MQLRGGDHGLNKTALPIKRSAAWISGAEDESGVRHDALAPSRR